MNHINDNLSVRFSKINLRNFRNVKSGEFSSRVAFETMNKSDVLGLYGQNGSGKTAIVDAFKVLSILLREENLKYVNKKLIHTDENELELDFEFLVKKEGKSYYIEYIVVLDEWNGTYRILHERLNYKENIKGKRYKELVSFNGSSIAVRRKFPNTMPEEYKVQSLVSVKVAKEMNSSIIFQDELNEVYKNFFTQEEYTLFSALYYEFANSLHIIENADYGLLMANVLMPFNFSEARKRGTVAIFESEDTPVSEEIFTLLKDTVFPSINRILPTIIPGLTIEISRVGEKLSKEGAEGIQVQLIAIRDHKRLPLSEESDGVKKIISILSVLSFVFNDSNACVVIDELDSGIFEYLLGELLKVIHESGRGQLIFTSHNLRILEMLPIENLWFTTTDENLRYVKLKSNQKSTNNRAAYIRALLMSDQGHELYERTQNQKIKQAFKKIRFLENEQ
ncbi:AAA family ATPase [Salinicoccus roseus]|uniref:AAA family ATPase n=1 Tax=Salinicoccus roseus TaxID=45670 RepID=UPI002300C182|nr:AAA family ATPase [Salinicoccus roseus]